MTVEEKILQYVGDSAKPTVKRLLKEHTIQIAEKAVEDEVLRKDTGYLFTSWSEEVGMNILSRIKTLTENEE